MPFLLLSAQVTRGKMNSKKKGNKTKKRISIFMPLTRLEKIYLVIWEKNWMLKISLIFFVIALVAEICNKCSSFQPPAWLILNPSKIETITDIGFTIWTFSTALVTFFLGYVRDKRYGIQIIDIILSGDKAYFRLSITAAVFTAELIALIVGTVYNLASLAALTLAAHLLWMIYFFMMICCETSSGIIQNRVIDKCRRQLSDDGTVSNILYLFMRNITYEDDSEADTLMQIVEQIHVTSSGTKSERDFISECTAYMLQKIHNKNMGYAIICRWLLSKKNNYIREGIFQGLLDNQYMDFCPDIRDISTVSFPDREKTILWGILYNEIRSLNKDQKYRQFLRRDLWDALCPGWCDKNMTEALEMWYTLIHDYSPSKFNGEESGRQDLMLNMLWNILSYERRN